MTVDADTKPCCVWWWCCPIKEAVHGQVLGHPASESAAALCNLVSYVIKVQECPVIPCTDTSGILPVLEVF